MTYKLGLRTPPDIGDTLWSDANEDTGMGVELYNTTDELGYIAGIYHDAVGLVTWFHVDSEYQARALIELENE